MGLFAVYNLTLKSLACNRLQFFSVCNSQCTVIRCGHCKNLAPHWASAATELKGKVKLGALDATAETVVAGRFGVSLVLHVV